MGNAFEVVNKINKSILEYQKSKYPKNKALPVPAGIENLFEKFNYLNLFQNDMLVNSGYAFTGNNQTRA